MRKVETASGTTAIQLVHKSGNRCDETDLIGSAHIDFDLHIVVATARRQLAGDLSELELGLRMPGPGRSKHSGVVESTQSPVLWRALERIYAHLEFDGVDDE